jgi:hypothetical protein
VHQAQTALIAVDDFVDKLHPKACVEGAVIQTTLMTHSIKAYE